MNSQNIRNWCFNCMRSLSEPDGVCPRCGWDNRRRENEEGQLSQQVLLNQYLVGRALGQGGFGVTYIGLDLNLKLRVAIKEYFPTSYAYRDSNSVTVRPYSKFDRDFKHHGNRALEEGRIVAGMDRIPNIVRIHNAFPANGTIYIVMEYVEGTDLTSIVKREKAMDWEKALKTLYPIMRALEQVHAKGIIHRDISPDNIMVRRDSGEPVLLDFGAARSTMEAKDGVSVVLKPGYAPPEQHSSVSSQDGRVDEYALCATMYYLITGQRPVAGDQRLIGVSELEAPHVLGAKLPAAVEQVLLKGMAIKPADRYPDMAALRRAFEQAEKKKLNPTVALTDDEVERRVRERLEEERRKKAKRRRRLLKRIGIALMCAAALAAAAILWGPAILSGPKPTPTPETVIITPTPTAAVATPTETPTPAPKPTEVPPTPTPTPVPSVEFSDAIIETAALSTLGKSKGPLYADELATITTLDLGSTALTDFSDLAHFPELKALYLHKNGIVDISSLAGLNRLEGLELSGNAIEDISALSGLSGLKALSLAYNKVSDLAPLKNLSQLKRLYLMGNQISDLSPLAGLTALKVLHIEDNPAIADLSPLATLTGLEEYGGPSWPWPKARDAVVLAVWPEDADDKLKAAFGYAMSQLGVAEYGSVAVSPEISKDVWKYYEESDAQLKKVDAIFVLADADVDYSLTKAKAVVMGGALHLSGAKTPAEVFDDVCALYGERYMANPY